MELIKTATYPSLSGAATIETQIPKAASIVKLRFLSIITSYGYLYIKRKQIITRLPGGNQQPATVASYPGPEDQAPGGESQGCSRGDRH
jgi:hypothetical protein